MMMLIRMERRYSPEVKDTMSFTYPVKINVHPSRSLRNSDGDALLKLNNKKLY